MASLADVFVAVKPDLKQFGPQVKREIPKHFDGRRIGAGMSKSLGSGFRVGIGGAARTMFAPIVAAAAAVGGLSLFKGWVADAREQQKLNKLTAAAIKATGGAADVTAKQVEDLATAMELKIGKDGQAIQAGANMLLTFKNVRNEAGKGNDIFNQSTQILTDMSAAMNGGNVTQENMRKQAIQLGKALNDPIRGMSALRRVGVTFTEAQEKQIKTLVESGDVMGAQKIILKELASEFGGAAKASSDPMERLGHIVGALGERVATHLLPMIEQAADWLGENLPVALETAERVGGELWESFKTNALPTLKDVFGFVKDDVVPRLVDLAGWIKQNKDVVLPFVAALGTGIIVFKTIVALTKAWAAAQLLWSAAFAASGIPLIIAAIAALAAGLIYAYHHSEEFRKIVDGAFDFIAESADSMWNDFLKPAFNAIVAAIEWIGDTAETLKLVWELSWREMKNTVIDGVKFIVDGFLRFVQTILNGADKAFGWIPGIDDDLDRAVKDFADFRRGVNNELDLIRDEDIKVNVKTYGNLEFGGAGGFGGAAIAARGGAGPLPGVTSHASQAMGGALDIKTLGLDANRISSLATDFVGQTKAAVQKQITKAFEAGTIGPAGFPLPRGRYRVGRGTVGHGYPAVDFPAAIGTPIYAVRSGVVTAARRLATSYGIHAILGHPGGWGSLYAHMSRMFVRSGQFVRAGQQLGRVGSTGNSTGPHLHFEARRNGRRVNPRSLISYANGGFINEHIVGLGMRSGRPYQFGERGTETVRPADMPMRIHPADILAIGQEMGRVVLSGIGAAQWSSGRTAGLYSRGG